MANNDLTAAQRQFKCYPGMEMGVHAGYDKEHRELVYIGIYDMVMHKDVLDTINAEWDTIFGEKNAEDK